MTTDKQPQTFEEWFDVYCRSLPKDMWSLRDSWNAGRVPLDAEIADLKRQVADADQKWIHAFGAQDLVPRVTPESLAKWVFRDVEQQLESLDKELANARRKEQGEINDWITARATGEEIQINPSIVSVEERINILVTLAAARARRKGAVETHKVPEAGQMFKCLICCHVKAWGIFDSVTGAAVCIDCRDAARYPRSTTIGALVDGARRKGHIEGHFCDSDIRADGMCDAIRTLPLDAPEEEAMNKRGEIVSCECGQALLDWWPYCHMCGRVRSAPAPPIGGKGKPRSEEGK